MSKDKKNKAHARRMEAKRLDKAKDDAVAATCRLVLLVMYAALHDEFGFGMKRLSRLRKCMDRYSRYVRDKEETGISQSLMMEILAKNGIDVAKIGDDYIKEMEEKSEETNAGELVKVTEHYGYKYEKVYPRKKPLFVVYNNDKTEGIAAYKEESLAREQCENLEKWNYSSEGKEERKRREETWNE